MLAARPLARTLALLLVAASCGGAGATRPLPPPTPKSAVTSAPPSSPPLPSFGSADVDRVLGDEWKRLGLASVGRAGDATWLRRVYVDVIGTIPPPDVAATFAADAAKDKRARMVDTLLASPGYAEHWASYWEEELLGKGARAGDLDRDAFRRWLRKRFAENARWDRIVTEIVTATGINSTGGPRTKPGAWVMPADAADESQVNGAVNFTLRYEAAPQDLAGMVSRTFLGTQIQCAQCHDHKTEPWKRTEFWSFAAAFARTRAQNLDDGKTMGIRRVELVDLDQVAPRFRQNGDLAMLIRAQPSALDGKSLGSGKDVRRALAAWMTAKDNPAFSRAFVNRMWGHFLGRGFVDPVDDIRPSNPATLAPLLDALAADFALHGYDVARLVRTIALSEAYQVEAGRAAPEDPENKTWSRFRLSPLGAEELLNAVFQATNVEETARRAGFPNIEQVRAQIARRYAFVFDVDEDLDTSGYEGTVSQALALLNGSLVGIGSSAIPGSALDDVLSSTPSDEACIDKLYLRTLARPATAEERARALAHVKAPPAASPSPIAPKPGDPLRRLGKGAAKDPRRAAYEDLFWALLNSSEFALNH